MPERVCDKHVVGMCIILFQFPNLAGDTIFRPKKKKKKKRQQPENLKVFIFFAISDFEASIRNLSA